MFFVGNQGNANLFQITPVSLSGPNLVCIPHSLCTKVSISSHVLLVVQFFHIGYIYLYIYIFIYISIYIYIYIYIHTHILTYSHNMIGLEVLSLDVATAPHCDSAVTLGLFTCIHAMYPTSLMGFYYSI